MPRSMSSTSIIDFIFRLKLLSPFIPRIILRLRFHCARSSLTSFSSTPEPLAIRLILLDLRSIGSSFSS